MAGVRWGLGSRIWNLGSGFFDILGDGVWRLGSGADGGVAAGQGRYQGAGLPGGPDKGRAPRLQLWRGKADATGKAGCRRG